MKIKAALGVAALALSLSATAVLAQASGTAAEAKAMLEKAIAALKADKTKALADFNAPDHGFRDRDLYVFCYNTTDGKFTSHANAKLLGTDVRTLTIGGQKLGEEIFNTAKPDKIATVDYMFPKPGATEPSPKVSFVTKVGDLGCGVGYYK